MRKVSFTHAFERWYSLTVAEDARTTKIKKSGGVVHSLEALDHLCGLAVESGLKALMIKAKLVSAEPDGDFPAINGRRPHVDALWDAFMAKAKDRTTSQWVKQLSGGAAAPATVFREWRAEHRYAADGTISHAAATARVDMAKRIKRIAEEEAL